MALQIPYLMRFALIYDLSEDKNNDSLYSYTKHAPLL
jgi:hypothetical protein